MNSMAGPAFCAATARKAPMSSAAEALPRGGAPRVLVIEADASLRELLGEWLAECGCAPQLVPSPGLAAGSRFDLVVVDVPFPRQGGCGLLRQVTREQPDTPVMVLSPTFFGSVACAGALAQAMRVSRVLPKPLTRDTLVGAVRQILPASFAAR